MASSFWEGQVSRRPSALVARLSGVVLAFLRVVDVAKIRLLRYVDL
jgi:hypothetical protein